MSDREERREDELSAAEFRRLFEAVSTWGRWGAEDERGALNYLTPARVLAATRLVRRGETVTLSLPGRRIRQAGGEFQAAVAIDAASAPSDTPLSETSDRPDARKTELNVETPGPTGSSVGTFART